MHPNALRAALIACLGLSQFKHAFRQQVGTSVSHYLRMRRMALAHFNLAERKAPLLALAMREGLQAVTEAKRNNHE